MPDRFLNPDGDRRALADEQFPDIGYLNMPRRDAKLAPSSVYFDGSDWIRITTFGNTAGLTAVIAWRFLGLDNLVRQGELTFTPSSNRVASSIPIPMAEGWLLGAAVKITAGNATAGAVWGVIEIIRGQSASARQCGALAYDFFTNNDPLMWPGDQAVDPSGGIGNIRSITGAVPGAGAEISEAVPAGARWDLLSAVFSLTTAVAVANRIVQVTLDDGANVYFRDSAAVVQAASLTNSYAVAQGQSKLAAPTTTAVIGNFPVGLTMLAGHRFRTNTVAIQAADQYTAPQYLVRERFDA
jgi:hypothetical protein